MRDSSFEGFVAIISRQSQNFANNQNRIFLPFHHLLCRNSCFAGPEYEVGDGVFDVRVCQYDTPIGEKSNASKESNVMESDARNDSEPVRHPNR